MLSKICPSQTTVYLVMDCHSNIVSFTVPYSGLYIIIFPRCKFSQMGSLLGKIYSRLLHEVQLWVTIAEIGMDAIMSRWSINI